VFPLLPGLCAASRALPCVSPLRIHSTLRLVLQLAQMGINVDGEDAGTVDNPELLMEVKHSFCVTFYLFTLSRLLVTPSKTIPGLTGIDLPSSTGDGDTRGGGADL